MIEYIKGEVIEVVPAQAVIECNGIGYAISISLNTFSAIQGKKEVKLYIYEAIREDAHILYGFYTRQERELFLLLITVSGIGGNTARMILSALSPSELCNVISSGNDKLLKTVKGIGLKTAQRIIVDLKDKIASTGIDTAAPVTSVIASANTEVYEEAVAALTMLGFAQAPSQKSRRSPVKRGTGSACRKGDQTCTEEIIGDSMALIGLSDWKSFPVCEI